MADEPGPLLIESTRTHDGEPACLLTWGPLQFYSEVAAVRETALDMVVCSVYSEMMMEMNTRAKIPPEIVSAFASAMLAHRTKRYFGHKTNVMLTPAGSSERNEAMVLLRRGSHKGYVTPGEARQTALDWMEAAEASESDTLLGRALEALPDRPDDLDERLFDQLRQLRAEQIEQARKDRDR